MTTLKIYMQLGPPSRHSHHRHMSLAATSREVRIATVFIYDPSRTSASWGTKLLQCRLCLQTADNVFVLGFYLFRTFRYKLGSWGSIEFLLARSAEAVSNGTLSDLHSLASSRNRDWKLSSSSGCNCTCCSCALSFAFFLCLAPSRCIRWEALLWLLTLHMSQKNIPLLAGGTVSKNEGPPMHKRELRSQVSRLLYFIQRALYMSSNLKSRK